MSIDGIKNSRVLWRVKLNVAFFIYYVLGQIGTQMTILILVYIFLGRVDQGMHSRHNE
jgi:hypothetical protein